MTNKSPLSVLLLRSVAFLVCTTSNQLIAFSKTDELLPVLDEVVVSPAQDFTDPFATATIVESRVATELENNLARSVPESLRYMPGVAVQKTANGQGSPIIRGFTGYRTLATIDGIRYNHSAYRDGANEYFALVDLYSLDRLELLQGPNSVLYGSDAVGGVLNLTTRAANLSHLATGDKFNQASIFSRWHSAEQSWQTHAEYNFGIGNQWGLHLGGTWKDFGDVIAAELGEQPKTGYLQPSFDARFDAYLDDYWTFTLAHQALAQFDSWRTHATIYGVSYAGSEVGSDLRRVNDYRRALSYLRFQGDDFPGFIKSARITASYQTLDEELDRIRSNRVQEFSGLNIATYGLDIQLLSSFLNGQLCWGIDYYHDAVDTTRRDFNPDGTLRAQRIQGAVGDQAHYNLLGWYIQQDMPLGQYGTVLQVGGRYTYAKAHVGRYENPLTGEAASLSEQWHNIVGNIRLLQDLDSHGHWKVYMGLSQAFRAPNLADLTRLGASRSDEIESAARNLQPERYNNFELGMKHREGKVRLASALFYTRCHDYITSTPTGRFIDGQRQVTKQNSATGYVIGATGEIEWDVTQQFTLFGSISWTEGEADAFTKGTPRREPLSRIPPLTGQFGLRWRSQDNRYWVDFSGTTTATADRLNSADRLDTQRIPPTGTPGYTLFNLLAGWQINHGVTLLAGLENLLDQAYRAHGSGSNEPGLGGVLGIRANF